jgi:ElaB/YqjD/DUF883 family membrane-anchored ribosome-binding protein
MVATSSYSACLIVASQVDVINGVVLRININKEKTMDILPRDVSKEMLVNDFKVVVADAEALLKATANQGGEKVAEIRVRAEESLKAAKARIAEAQSVVIAKSKEAAKVTDAYVHEHPWKSIGTAAAVGMVIGLLIGRK